MPISPEEALVTVGPSYEELCEIHRCRWSLENGFVELSEGDLLAEGSYLRLGNLYNDELVFSSGRNGPHQMFKCEFGTYWTDDAPHGRLYMDGEVLVDHWDDYKEVGNPWVDESGMLYFEARRKPAPAGWEIWRINGFGKKIFVRQGANPCIYDGQLYCSQWLGRRFDLAITDRLY